MRCCIKDNCGMPFDPYETETRPWDMLRAFWYMYCPEHRDRPITQGVVIKEQR